MAPNSDTKVGLWLSATQAIEAESTRIGAVLGLTMPPSEPIFDAAIEGLYAPNRRYRPDQPHDAGCLSANVCGRVCDA
jgi:hypothetical protein